MFLGVDLRNLESTIQMLRQLDRINQCFVSKGEREHMKSGAE